MSYVYLAGPMRGLPGFNFPVFRQAAQDLRKRGLHVCSPHEADEVIYGEVFDDLAGTDAELLALKFNLPAALADCCSTILSPLCEGVVLLPGWERSTGARAEAHLAWAVGKHVRLYYPPDRANGFHHELWPITVPDYAFPPHLLVSEFAAPDPSELWQDGERRPRGEK